LKLLQKCFSLFFDFQKNKQFFVAPNNHNQWHENDSKIFVKIDIGWSALIFFGISGISKYEEEYFRQVFGHNFIQKFEFWSDGKASVWGRRIQDDWPFKWYLYCLQEVCQFFLIYGFLCRCKLWTFIFVFITTCYVYFVHSCAKLQPVSETCGVFVKLFIYINIYI